VSPAYEPELLDLRIHSIEEIPGKRVIFNQIPYVVLDMIGEGGEAWVYAIKNCRTKMIQFVVKVFRFQRGSSEFEDILQNRSLVSFELRAMSATEKEDGTAVADLEVYEVHGGLLGFQELFGGIPNPDYQTDLMTAANRLAKEDLYEDAIQTYDRVLERNPDHTDALENKATCLARAGKLGEAFAIMTRCMELEPNLRELYRRTAEWQVQAGNPRAALQVLEQTFRRNSIDFLTWRQLSEVAIEHDLVGKVEKLLREVMERYPESDFMKVIGQHIAESQRRAASLTSLLGAAADAQRKSRWQDAFDLLTRAIDISKNNDLARLNRSVCSYRLGDYTRASDDIWSTAYLFRGSTLWSAALIGMLSSAKAAQWERSKAFALLISGSVKHPMDLPQVPVTVTEEFSLESKGVAEITDVVTAIRDSGTCDREQLTEVDALLSQYCELGRALEASGK
jgi:tetratricopeptide (TPR) repeat protein